MSESVTFDLRRRLVAEGLGTAFLVAAVVGSGIMAERLTTDTGLALLANTLATGAMLVVLITVFGPLSGAHFNPAVTFVMAFVMAFVHKGSLNNGYFVCLQGGDCSPKPRLKAHTVGNNQISRRDESYVSRRWFEGVSVCA